MELPLSTVLDRELGIGYPTSSQNMGDINPLIDDLVMPASQSRISETRQTPVDRVLFRKYIDCVRKGENDIELTDSDFERLSFTHQLPDSISVMCCLMSNEQIYVKSIGGACGISLMGRFCHLDNDLKDLVKEVTDFEQERNADIIYADISHLPESRIGNIASRPSFYKYTLHYLSNCDHTDTAISVSDLMLSVHKGRLHLRSKQFNKEVIPRLSCAHNYLLSPLPIYRFLCDLQYQDITGGLSCGWTGLLSAFEYLPRIHYKNFILSRERWKIRLEEIAEFDKLQGNDLYDQLKSFLRRKHIPTYVIIPDSDNELFLDMNNYTCLSIFMSEIKKRKEIYLEEFIFDRNNAIVKQGKDIFTNEAIFIFHK